MRNTFGNILQLTTWGESHGKAVGAILDGLPALIEISENDIQIELDKRKPNPKNIASTNRKEADKVEILSGIFKGKSTGAPISMIIYNKDQKSKDYSNIKDIYRPGHADLSYDLKWGLRDYRGGGRSSGRETAARVMGGAIAKKLLKQVSNTKIIGYTIQIGEIKIDLNNFDYNEIENNNIRCPDKQVVEKINQYITDIKNHNDSIGGIVEIIVKNPPIGLGEPCFDKLHAELSKALLSIGSVKGFEIGTGFKVANMKGSENNDTYSNKNNRINTINNYSGGIQGGISFGPDLIMRIAIKPTSSIRKKQITINKELEETEIEIQGRHDACIVPRLIPVAEAMVALTLADFYLLNKVSKL